MNVAEDSTAGHRRTKRERKEFNRYTPDGANKKQRTEKSSDVKSGKQTNSQGDAKKKGKDNGKPNNKGNGKGVADVRSLLRQLLKEKELKEPDCTSVTTKTISVLNYQEMTHQKEKLDQEHKQAQELAEKKHELEMAKLEKEIQLALE